jgi:hypothetical protein
MQREQLQHWIFLAGQIHAYAVDLDRLGVEFDDEITGLDDGLGMALGAPHDRVDARNQFERQRGQLARVHSRLLVYRPRGISTI